MVHDRLGLHGGVWERGWGGGSSRKPPSRAPFARPFRPYPLQLVNQVKAAVGGPVAAGGVSIIAFCHSHG